MAPRRGRRVVKTTKVVEETTRTLEVVSTIGSQSQSQEEQEAQAQAQSKAQPDVTKRSESRRSSVVTKSIPVQETTQEPEPDIPIEEAAQHSEAQNKVPTEEEAEDTDATQEPEPDIPMEEAAQHTEAKNEVPTEEEAGDTETQDEEPEFPVEEEAEEEEPEVPTGEEEPYIPKEWVPKMTTPPREEAPPRQEEEEVEEAQAQGEGEPKKERPARKERARTGKKRRKRGEGGEGYKVYVYRVMKQVHPGMGITAGAMTVINNFMEDMFERLAGEAYKLSMYSKKQTMSAREIQGAVKLVLPGELGKHAVAEGSKAVTNYVTYASK